MNQEPTILTAGTAGQTSPVAPVGTADIDQSFREFLLVSFVCSAFWLLAGSVFGLIASIKFHGPNFLADIEWLTYGRVRPAQVDCLLYGLCVPAGTSLGLWLFGRLGRARLAYPLLAIAGLIFYQLGVLSGVFGVLAGDTTGYAYFEFPNYSIVLLLLGYLLVGWCAVVTLHQRFEPNLYVSQWFALAALFWFPWIATSAWLLLVIFPVRGIAQSSINWWFTENLQIVWLWLSGLALVFYLVPKVTGRALHSRYLALFTFWILLLFGSWGGIPRTAPLPAWLPVLSTVGTVLSTLVPLLVFLNLKGTLAGRWRELTGDPVLRFVGVSLLAFFLAAIMRVGEAIAPVGRVVDFTWFSQARVQVNLYGFFAMAAFAGAYYVLARVPGLRISAGLVRAHFWLALGGILLGFVPLAVGGIVEGLKVNNPDVAFMEVVKTTLNFLRVSTLGDLLLLAGHMVFFVNLAWASKRLCQERLLVARESIRQPLYVTAEASR